MFRFLSKRPSVELINIAGRRASAIVLGSMNTGCSYFMASSDEVEEAIYNNLTNQILFAALAHSLTCFTLQDAYYDAGLAGPLDGMPKINLKDVDRIQMMRLAANPVLGASRRIIEVYQVALQGNLPKNAADAWERFQVWTDRKARCHFELRDEYWADWVGFVVAIAQGRQSEAMDMMRNDMDTL